MRYFAKHTGLAASPDAGIGQEGDNLWLSFAGRVFLCAREHLRGACPDELWELTAELEEDDGRKKARGDTAEGSAAASSGSPKLAGTEDEPAAPSKTLPRRGLTLRTCRRRRKLTT